jgi:phosphate/sulfate permease
MVPHTYIYILIHTTGGIAKPATFVSNTYVHINTHYTVTTGGIAKPSTFVSNPPAFAYGMSVVLWLGFIVQMIASYMGLNVSATHCLIGGIIGFAMAWGGADSVYWAEPDRYVFV